MTVKELKEMLDKFDDDMEVAFAYQYGDHWRTTVADIVEDAREEMCSWSDYHDTWRVNDMDDDEYDDRDDSDNLTEMLILWSM